MGSKLPPAMEAAQLLREKHLLGCTHSRPGPADSGEDLRSPIHIECLYQVSNRWNGDHPVQAVALQRVFRCGSPALFHGMLSGPDSAPRCRAASLHEYRVRGGTLLDAGCQSAAVRGAGRDGYSRVLAEKQHVTMKKARRLTFLKVAGFFQARNKGLIAFSEARASKKHFADRSFLLQ